MLEHYLELEKIMLAIEADHPDIADLIRDAMEPLWYLLNPEEVAYLDGRTPKKVVDG